MNVTMKRGLGILLSLCMVLSLVVLPNASEAKAATADIISTPTTSHAMDTISGVYPSGWEGASRYPSGKINTDTQGRTFYTMTLAAQANNNRAGVYGYTLPDNGIYTNAVLKYDFMLNNDAASWTANLPQFSYGSGNNNLSLLNVTQDMTLNGHDLTAGQWYTVEVVLLEGKYDVYLNGEKVVNQQSIYNYSTYNMHCINMGLTNPGASETASASLNVDNLAVYTYVPEATFGATPSYEINKGSSVVTEWSKTDNAYLTGVTFESSDPDVATVDATGLVTGVSAGVATITATPNAASGMAAATTTVTVKDPNSLQSQAVYVNSMDEMGNGTYLPVDFSRNNQFVYGSSIKEDADRTYYQMKRGNKEGAAYSWGYVQPTGVNFATGTAVLKYDIMIDNGELEGWSVYLPSFTGSAGGRTIGLTVAGDMKLHDYQLTAGTWYAVELVAAGGTYRVYVNGELIYSHAYTGDLAMVNMGIDDAGGNSHTNSSSGATIYGDDVAMNIDNLEVYSYDYAIFGTSMTLDNNLNAQFWIQPTPDVTDLSVKVIKEVYGGDPIVTTIPQSEWLEDDGNKYVTVPVAAKEMGDKFTVAVCDSEGWAVSMPYGDSIKDYLSRVAAGTDNTELKTLCEDLLVYGAAAQQKFDYNTGNLVAEVDVSGVTGSGSSEKAEVEGWIGSTLVLESNIQMKVYFETTAANTYTVEFTDHYGHAQSASGSLLYDEGDKTNKYVPIDGLVLADINTVVKVTVGDAEVNDSIANFIARSKLTYNDAIYDAIVQAGNSADAYFHDR